MKFSTIHRKQPQQPIFNLTPQPMPTKDSALWQKEIDRQTVILSNSNMDTDPQSVWAWFLSSYKLNKSDRAIISRLLGVPNEALC